MPKQTFTETRLYPVILHHEGGTWGYASPEFGGGGATTQTDALTQAQQMLDSAVADLYEAGETIPTPSSLDDIDPEGGKIAWLPVTISNTSERIFLTLPQNLLRRIDGQTRNRSAWFAELARNHLKS